MQRLIKSAAFVTLFAAIVVVLSASGPVNGQDKDKKDEKKVAAKKEVHFVWALSKAASWTWQDDTGRTGSLVIESVNDDLSVTAYMQAGVKKFVIEAKVDPATRKLEGKLGSEDLSIEIDKSLKKGTGKYGKDDTKVTLTR